MSENAAMRAARRAPSIPAGEIVATYSDYAAAKGAVSRLSETEFPIDRVAIIGSDLKSIERVTGHMTAGRAALAGLMSGVMLALFAGCIVLILNPGIEFASLLSMGLIALGFGVLWSLLAYALNPVKRDFTSVMLTLATRFDLVVPPEHAAAARQGLEVGPQAAQQAPAYAPVGAQAVAGGAPTATFNAPQGGGTPESANGHAPADPAVRPRTYGEALDERRQVEDGQRPATDPRGPGHPSA